MGKKYDGVRAVSGKSIEIDFYYGGKRNRERIALEPTPTNLRRAANHRAAILDAITNGTFDYAATFPNSKRAQAFKRAGSTQFTIEEYLLEWLLEKKPTLKASTFNGYDKVVRFNLIPNIGKIAVVDLKRGHIRKWLMDTSIRNKTITNILSVLRSAMTDAMMDELIENNPLLGWTYKKVALPNDNKDPDPFSTDEQAAILSVLSGERYNQILFCFWTGVRTSELVALDWDDVDFVNGTIRISKAKTQASDEIETTKTLSSIRDIKMLAPAREALLAQKEHTYLKGKEIFRNPRTKERWEGDAAIRKTLWMPALKKCGVRYRKPYQTRHTYASMMLSAGEHPAWLAGQMGHKDWGMIRQIYAKWMKPEFDDSGNKAEALFGKNFHSVLEVKTHVKAK